LSKYFFCLIVLTMLFQLSSCSKYTYDYGEDIHFVFDDGLNNDPDFRLERDENGYFLFPLYTGEGQNVQRISVRLLRGADIVYTLCSGYSHQVSWNNNLHWWLLEGDTIATITYTYFNPFTGEIEYVNLPPLINWKDVLVPTINPSSLTDVNTGRASAVLAPIAEMKGDTMKVFVNYTHNITKQKEGDAFFEIIGERKVVDSVFIILQ
jgi:hypothetical protein